MLFYLRAILDLFLPRECLACGCRLGLRERHLCLACAADVPYTYHWLSAHNPLADRFNAVLERHRPADERMDYAYAAALMHYKGPYRAIPRALKYHGDLAAGRFFGGLLGRRLAFAPHFADVDLIIPVPLHWTRRRSRGYNQAEILARAICDAFCHSEKTGGVCSCHSEGLEGASYCHSEKTEGRRKNLPSFVQCRSDILLRARRTRTQTKLTIEQKARNVASAFQVSFAPIHRDASSHPLLDAFRHLLLDALHLPRLDRESPQEALAHARHILLVDDTFTTGATLYACYAALRPYTSARISIATLAAVEGTPSSGP
ncbi:MAG: ComF family protein [Bacteroidales bacterium]|nr:ComF family protein [Bacteroidales bacterium]